MQGFDRFTSKVKLIHIFVTCLSFIQHLFASDLFLCQNLLLLL